MTLIFIIYGTDIGEIYATFCTYQYERQGLAPQHRQDPLVPVFPSLVRAGFLSHSRDGYFVTIETPWVESQSGSSCRVRPPSLIELRTQGQLYIIVLLYLKGMHLT